MSFQDLQNGRGGPSSSRSQSASQAVAAGIFQINTGVAGLRRLVEAIGTVKDTPDHRQKLHDSRQRILHLVKDTSAKLKSLSESDRDIGVNQSKKIEDAKLARDFQSTLQEFQKVQQLAAERESTYAPAGLPPSSITIPDSVEPVTSEGAPEHQPFLVQQKRQELILLDNEVAFNEAMIEERDQGIREVEQQIGQANDIFKDLAVLVHEQGIVIDDIQSHVENSASATRQGRVQLAKTSKSAKSGCSWCWWLLGIVVVALIVFLVVIFI
ncbi:hypothetical protein SAY86_001364 [Trapa natans]|uniref:t-SNARE coiled-coil homology domain-containing protein n=1 Tax=Trapa natans TaxID=22666 RepID=A0AAN7RMB9_TRANT|nr:hypothetical protein SAY86_001364 [Trapa natans]